MCNFMKNDDGAKVICGKVDGITVISNLVRPPLIVACRNDKLAVLLESSLNRITQDFCSELWLVSECPNYQLGLKLVISKLACHETCLNLSTFSTGFYWLI